MGTFHWQGGPVHSPSMELHGPGDVEVDVSVRPPLGTGGRIEVQESADRSVWVSHPMPSWTGQEWTVHLPGDRARGFVRLRVDSGEPGPPPRRIRFRVRRSGRGPGNGRGGGGS